MAPKKSFAISANSFRSLSKLLAGIVAIDPDPNSGSGHRFISQTLVHTSATVFDKAFMNLLDNLVAAIETKPVNTLASDASSAMKSLSQNILIVDDDPDASWLLAHLLAKAGYRVQLAKSAEEAMMVLYSFTPNAVLMDVNLPGMDGLQLTRLIKLTAAKNVPILAVSAGNGEFSIQNAYEAGCDGYIAKPVDSRNFVATVGQYLG